MRISENQNTRNNLILTVIAIVFYVGWTGIEFYRAEMWRKHEALMNKLDREFKAAERAKDLEIQSIEREKDRELQREIIRAKANSHTN